MSEKSFPVYGSGASERLLVYVNPGFNGWHGHYLTQLGHLQTGAQLGYYDLIHLGNSGIDDGIETASAVVPFFDFKPEVAKYGTEDEINRAINDFEVKLRCFFDELHLELSNYLEVRLYQFTGHPKYSFSYEKVIGEYPEFHSKLKAVNNFLYRNNENECREDRTEDDEISSEILEQFAHTISAVDSKVYLKALNEKEIYGVKYLPFPVLNSGSSGANDSHRRLGLFSGMIRRISSRRPKLKVLYLGYPHSKWGYQEVYKSYREIVEGLGIEDFEFHVRHQDVHGDTAGETIKTEWLRHSNCIVHYEGFLSLDHYYEVLNNADIVLIPYSPEFYVKATSGVFVEAILACAVVITTAGTWMANELSVSKCGHIYEYGYPDQLTKSLLRVRGDFQNEKAKTSELAVRYHEEYSINAFSQNIFQKENFDEKYNALLQRVPERDPIYLPTGLLSMEKRVSGLARVVDVWENEWIQAHQPRIREIKESLTNTNRCFVIGNGPSLNQMDLELLKGEVVFASNGFYMLYDRISWRPDYYFVEDHLVAEDRGKSIPSNDGSIKFYPIYLAYAFEKQDDVVFYNHRPRVSYPHGFDFSSDASNITYTGCTVLFSCLQFAYYFGFKEVYLIGVDLEYKKPDDLVKTSDYGVPIYNMESDDPNHFHKDYFGKGYRWHEPQEDKMAQAFEESESICSLGNVKIFNAGVGGNLNCFPRVPFENLF